MLEVFRAGDGWGCNEEMELELSLPGGWREGHGEALKQREIPSPSLLSFKFIVGWASASCNNEHLLSYNSVPGFMYYHNSPFSEPVINPILQTGKLRLGGK